MSAVASPNSGPPRSGASGTGNGPSASVNQAQGNTSAAGSKPASANVAQNQPTTKIAASPDQAARLREIVSNFQQGMVSSFGVPDPNQGVVKVPTIKRSAAPTPFAPSVLAASDDSIAAPVRLRKTPILAITSGKGGVGKTSIAVNIAALLARRHLRLTLLDADLGLANADVLCGLSPTRRLDSVLTLGEAHRRMPQIAVDAPGGFKLIPGAAGQARMANLNAPERAALLDSLLDLEDSNDLIVIDTGAGVSDGVVAFARYADIACVVVTPEPTSIADAYATIKILRNPPKQPQLHTAQVQNTRVVVLVNQVIDEQEALATYARLRATSARFLNFEPMLLGWVRRDSAIPASIRARGPASLLHPEAPAVQDLRTIAEQVARLAGIKLVEVAKPEPKGLWSWLFSRE